MARYIAKNLVAAGLADRVEVQLAYAIGVADPVSVHVETFGTEKVDPALLPGLVRDHFKLTPKGIIESLDLQKADLPEDGGLRPLRAPSRRVHVGEDRQGRGARRRGRALRPDEGLTRREPGPRTAICGLRIGIMKT